jgi:hypothetical protein
MNELSIKLASDWPAIRKATANTERDLTELERLLLPSDGRPLAENVSLVFFRSLAHGESTSQSDLDWTLLVNCEVDGQHFSLSQSIRKKLRDKIGPGATVSTSCRTRLSEEKHSSAAGGKTQHIRPSGVKQRLWRERPCKTGECWPR